MATNTNGAKLIPIRDGNKNDNNSNLGVKRTPSLTQLVTEKIVNVFRGSKHDVQFSPAPISREMAYALRKLSRSESKPIDHEDIGWDITIEDGEDDKITNEESNTLSLKDSFADQSNPISMSILYGMINTAIVLPVVMSFGNIIYRDEFFIPYLPVLVKLTVISALVHQTCFSYFSSLPFAVGQVQDAGLIFLSKMATSMVHICQENENNDAESILATVTIGLAIYTACLGMALIIIGKIGLAQYVQKLPTSVVGGYLAFIGFFCGQSALSMMAGVEINDFRDYSKLADIDILKLILPGVIGGLTIYLSVKTLRHMAVLPTCIIAILLAFYAVLEITGTPLEQARIDGWVSEADAPPVWYRTWDYLRFDKVVWSAIPPQFITFVGMVFVVALSSSLDIAAIELELSQPLDYNHELKTVGVSNVISGLTGGYTGSYIFSQTIFFLRSGIRSRLAGYVVVIAELISVVVPISILAYMPNFFFGSLLIMICVDLMYEWLWEVRRKTTPTEYFVALSTFVLTAAIDVEKGILAGLGLYLILMKLGFDVGSIDSDTPQGSPSSDEAQPILGTKNSQQDFDYGGMNEKLTEYKKMNFSYYSNNGEEKKMSSNSLNSL